MTIDRRWLYSLCCVACLLVCGSGWSAITCPRFATGSTISAPEDLYSGNGLLRVSFSYQTATDSLGRTLYCFTNSDGAESPTLHVFPGDELVIVLTNKVPPTAAMAMSSQAMAAMPDMVISGAGSPNCGATVMTPSSVNMHFHGTNTSPTCHQDEVIKTVINSGQTFEYDVHIPSDEPPGVYWYHPHIHGIAEPAVQGGASGAIIVEGIQNVAPVVAGLPQRLLIVRDNNVNPAYANDPNAPAWDLSLNYTPVPYPSYTPARVPIRPGEQEFWRVLNAAADTILDVQLVYDGVAQPIRIVALDGVPTNSQDGTATGSPVAASHVLLPPASRAEFIMTGPSVAVKSAQFVTNFIDTGPDGDLDPTRPIAQIVAQAGAPIPARVPAVNGGPVRPRFQSLASIVPTVHRKLYFSEVLTDPSNPNSPTNFFITVDGQTPVLFSPDNPPAIVTYQGSVEDWTIENRAFENHEFHIHQLHFLQLEANGVPVADGQYLDTINIPYWTGTGPYPSVKVRMDFRGNIVGDFVYHCHILGHEDGGMMAILRVLPSP